VANPDRRNVRVLFMVNFYLTQRRFIQEITQNCTPMWVSLL